MFVSSYSTYINTNASDKIQKERSDAQKTITSSFESALESQTVDKSLSIIPARNQLPVNYISNYKALNNQQKLQREQTLEGDIPKETTKSVAQTKFTALSTLQVAQVAYKENFQLFPLRTKPKVTLSQTPKLSSSDSKESLLQQKTLRHIMVNTYIANDSYYKITA